MKNVYSKPSMAVSLFYSTDNTSIDARSSVAAGRGITAEKYGITKFNAGDLLKN